jgi:pyruvate/2-oxoglutarate dehydrogenase complex dihydrolipoamide dehydrogenase (E3) component
VAVVERHLVGGTCVNTGCTPTKALVASAYAARIARRAAEYGVVIGGDIGIDMRRVKARADAIVAASRNGLTSALENAANITARTRRGERCAGALVVPHRSLSQLRDPADFQLRHLPTGPSRAAGRGQDA